MLKTKSKPTRQRVNLLERVMAPPSGRIDRAAGVIRGVKILGASSKNGREYSPQALKEAAAMYEGIGVNVNHPNRSTPNASRGVEEGVGWLENVQVKSDGVYGDLNVLKSHRLANSIFETAERNPRRFGLSHNAAGNCTTRNGKTYVESMDNVRSVDLVQNPATVNSLFESHEPRYSPVRFIVGDRALSLATKMGCLRSLIEGGEDMSDAVVGNTQPVDDPADTSVDDPAISAATDSIVGILNDTTIPTADKSSRIRKILQDFNAGVYDVSPDAVPTDGPDMSESLNHSRGLTRRQLDRAREGASSFLESCGGRPIAGTQRAADHAAAVTAMVARYR